MRIPGVILRIELPALYDFQPRVPRKVADIPQRVRRGFEERDDDAAVHAEEGAVRRSRGTRGRIFQGAKELYAFLGRGRVETGVEERYEEGLVGADLAVCVGG